MTLTEDQRIINRKKTLKKYYSKPEVKIKMRDYYSSPKEKEKRMIHNQKPEVKESRRKYSQTEESKKRVKEYQKRPEIAKKLKEYNKEYQKRHEVKLKQKGYDRKRCKTSRYRLRVKRYRESLEFKKHRKEYRHKPENLEKSNQYVRNRYKNDISFRCSMLLRSRVRKALRIYTNTGKIYDSKTYGVDYNAIIEHLKPFPENISEYHIDHIKPLCTFNLEDPEEIKKAFAPSNHQWLLGPENLSKGSQYPYAVTYDQSILNSLEISA